MIVGVTDFFGLDVETANADFSSICSIGLVHFRSGQVHKSLQILVDPEDDFDPANIAIHGIRPEDVAGRPTMAKVFPIIAESLKDTALIHHSPFDRTALARAAAKYGAEGLPCTWLDSVQVARRSWEQYRDQGGYGLANLAGLMGIPFTHHNAAEDARAAGLIVLKAIEHTGVSLQAWIDDLGYQSTGADTIPRPIRRPSHNVKHAREGNPDGALFGETLVFTGSMTIPRGQAAALAATAGCAVMDSVTKKTTILVVGDQDLRLTKGQEKSAKQRKAEELISHGAAIRIIGETDFSIMVHA